MSTRTVKTQAELNQAIVDKVDWIDWRDDAECGGGLHFGPTPAHALAYFMGATKFVSVGVKVFELRQIPGSTAKAKAPRVVRACEQVDINGKPIPVAA